MNNVQRRNPARRRGRRRITAVVLVTIVLSVLMGPAAGAAVAERPDNTWGTNGRVYAILPLGDRVYVGGSFTAAVSPSGATVSRRNLLALKTGTGELDTDFRPDPSGEVEALAASGTGGVIYAGGSFRTIGGLSRKNLAAVDTVTGRGVSGWRADTNAKVIALAFGNGRLYAGGAFTSVTDSSGTRSRVNVAAVAAGTGAIDGTWAPRVVGEDPVRTMALSTDGGRLFFGGDFTEVNGAGRRHLAAVNAVTGALDTTFVAKELPVVFGLTVDSVRVYVALGGSGGEVQGLDVKTGAKRWAVHGNGNFQSVAVHGDLVYVGGHYGGASGFGGKARNKLAAVNAATGAVSDFAPNVNSPLGVFEVAADAGHVYIGGDFTAVSGEKQPHFAQLSD